jgi:two-component system, chemotaxis family, sensor kinase CheA
MDFDRAGIVKVFVDEVEENLTRAQETTIELEARPEDPELQQALFRCIHTIKGGADSLGFEMLTSLAHAVEDLLDDLRLGCAKVNPQLVSLLLESFDVLRSATNQVRASGSDSGSVSPALVSRIQRARAEFDSGTVENRSLPERRFVPAHAPEALVRHETVRVDMKKLDAALDLAGELSVALGRLETLVSMLPEGPSSELAGVQQSAAQLHRELQDRIVALRMVPIGPTLRGFVRTVRDVALVHGKQARLSVQGGDVTVDANVIEQLREPMTHLVRNAIDHGIESIERRITVGKDPLGCLMVRARRDAGAIVVEFEDDGAGLSRQRIVERAKALGLFDKPPDDDDAIFALIFASGFSTAERVTDLSGRGVGLDAVKRAIESLRGSVQVTSVEGVGTKVILRLPVSLALLDGFGVVFGQDAFVLPREAVRQCVAFPGTDTRSVGVLEMRSRSLPFISLGALFDRETTPAPGRRHLIVLENGGNQLGLVVDDVLGDQRVVVKPLGSLFRDVRAVIGCTMAGDGSVALVLDVAGLFAAARRRPAARPLAADVGLQ